MPLLLLLLVFARTVFAQETVAHPGADGRGQLVTVGEVIAGATVSKVETHPEFERVHFAEGGPAPVELVAVRLDREGICSHHRHTLFPRWELVGPVPEDPWHEGERPPETDEERVHAALCARLAEVGGRIDLGASAAPGQESRQPAPAPMVDLPVSKPPVGFLQPVVWGVGLFTLGLSLVGLRRLDRVGRRDVAMILALSVLVRLALAPRVVFNGALAGYEKLGVALGLANAPAQYGQGYRALMAPFTDLMGGQPDTVLTVNLVLACLAPVALWAALRASGPLPARLGGLLLAVLPQHLMLSATEVMTVPLVTLSLVAAACAVRARAGWTGLAAGALCGLAAGLAVHVRPEGLLLLPALAAMPLVAHGRGVLRDGGPWIAALVGGVLVLLRFSDLPSPGSDGPVDLTALAQPATMMRALVPSWGDVARPVHLFLDASWTSPLLWLGALAALVLRRRAALPWVLWWGGSAILLAKSWPLADAHRLQLVAVPAQVALAALGLSSVAMRLKRNGGRVLPFAVLPAAVLLTGLPLAWARLDLVRHHEWRWLAETLPTLPEGSVLLVDDASEKASDMRSILTLLAPGLAVRPAEAATAISGELLLVGSTCVELPPEDAPVQPGRSVCAELADRCTLDVVDEILVPARIDLDARLRPDRVEGELVRLGVYRLSACRPPAEGTEGPR